MVASPDNVGAILDCLDERADAAEHVSVADIIGSFGKRTFGPAMMLPALVELTPIGAIPGVPTFLAAIIVLVALQKLLGRSSIWLPGFIGNRCVSSEKLRGAIAKLRRLAGFTDRHFHGRLQWLTRAPFSLMAAAIVVLLAATVPFLEVLPFASSGPMLAIAMFGLAILVRDGVLMVAALCISVAAMGLGVDWWDGGMSDTEAADGVVTKERVEEARRTAEDARDRLRDAREEAAHKATETVNKAREQAEQAMKETRAD